MAAGTPTRPTGITILAVLAAIGGVVSLLGGLALVGIGGLAGAATGSPVVGGLVAVIGLAVLVLGVIYIAFAYGAWQLRPWAWSLGAAAAVVGIVLSIVQAATGTGDIVSAGISIAINGVILYYLNSPEVRQAFGRPASGWR